MAEAKLIIDIAPFREKIRQIIRDEIVLDIGGLWDEYCYNNNVPPEIKLHGISFLEDFANRLEK